MFHACVRTFDVTDTVEIFLELNMALLILIKSIEKYSNICTVNVYIIMDSMKQI